MISAAQASQARKWGSRVLEQGYATTVTFPSHDPIAAASWRSMKSAQSEQVGERPIAAKSFRIRRELLPEGLTIREGATTLTEDGVRYQVERIQDAKGDPAILLRCLRVT